MRKVIDGFGKERVVSICNGILEERIKIAWRCETRIQDLNEGLIALMAKAGCIGINMGLESASDSVLANMKRKVFDLKKAIRLIKSCKKHNVEINGFFIIGLPGETILTSLKTIYYALRLNPDFLQFTVATPYIGTGLRKWADERGYIEDYSLSSLTGSKSVMRNEKLSTFQIELIRKVAYYMLWVLKPKNIIRRLNLFER